MKKTTKTIRGFMEERNWQNAVPSNIAKSISIESAELLEHFQWHHDSIETVKKDKKKVEEISLEIADIVIYSLFLADMLGIDMEKAIGLKLKQAAKKYPVKIFNKKVMPGTETYWKIKEKSRKK